MDKETSRRIEKQGHVEGQRNNDVMMNRETRT